MLLPIITGIGAALRLPAISIFFANLAGTVLAFLATRITRSLAINLTIVIMIIGLALTMALAINALFAGLSYVVPPSLSQGFSFFVPDNAIGCVSTILSARVIRWVWVWQFYVVTAVVS